MFPPLPNPDLNAAENLGVQDIVQRSASSVPPPTRQLTQVAKLIDVSKCIGCKACQSACMEWNDLREPVGSFHGTYQNPMDLTPESLTVMLYDEWVNPETQNLEWLIRKDGCMHCAEPGCLKACPSPGAIVQYTNGIVDFVHDNCIGCGYCVKGCPFNIPRVSPVTHRAYKCTLCSDRVAVGLGPACQKACPTQAIVFGTKEEMKGWAEIRIKDLKSRGYSNAGLYDPPGVGGTHVMYVLHHADKPELYGGLPKNPRISPLVEIWKGMAKYAGMAAMAGLAIVSAFHYVISGPNSVTKEEEEDAKRLAGGSST